MRSFLLNKLVRDKIVADMQAMGQQAIFRKLDDAEFRQKLAEKLVEETAEFKASSPEKALKELADVLEVVEALAKEYGATPEQLRQIQAERRAKRGGFEQRLYVERLDLQDNDKWAAYYAANPIKFPEIKPE